MDRLRQLWPVHPDGGRPRKTVFPTCAACHDAGWRPRGFVSMN